MKTNARERGLATLRESVGRLAGGLNRRRSGVWYVTRRTVASGLEQLGRTGDGPAFTVRRIAEVEARRPGARVHDIHPATRLRLPVPRVHTDRTWVFAVRPVPTEIELPAMQVLDVPDGVVFGSDGALGLGVDEIVVDVPTVFGLSEVQLRRRADVARRLGTERRPGTTVSLLQHSIGNHAHWLRQGVPRLALVREVVALDDVDRVLVNAEAPRVVFDALERLGVGPERIERVPEPAPVLACERLVVATPRPEMTTMPDWARQFVRELFVDADTAPTPRRLLVTRPDTARRGLVNGAEVRDALLARGFEPVAMEGLTMAEQAALFAGADTVVAEHGAALANLVFADPPTHVVELIGANTLVWVFAIEAVAAGLGYDALVGTEAAPPRNLWSWQIDADQRVDVDRLTRVVDAITPG